MNRYTSYEADDFVQDDFFCHWVLNPDSEAEVFWKNWLAEHPDQQDAVLKARVIVQQMNAANQVEVSDDFLSDSWEAIEMATKESKRLDIYFTSKGIYRGIAAAVILLVISAFFYQKISLSDGMAYATPSVVEWMVLENNTSAVQRLELADGSVITLEPKSLLRYPSFFTGKNRSVVLEGEAFFDIARDTTLPFIVYANETVIRVLGTSFYVFADEEEDDIEVVVKTGKVAVYKREELTTTSSRSKYNTKATPILVTPNQKVVFEKGTKQLSKRLTSTPSLVVPLGKLPKRKFEDTPVGDIFQALEEAYGVSIVWNSEQVENCLLTTTLTEQSLFEKLEIICTPLGLQYHEQNAGIIISGSCDHSYE